MFDHVTLRSADRAASERFYRTVLATLGRRPDHGDGTFLGWGEFAIAAATAERPPTRRAHVGFFAPTVAEVEAFWRAGVDAGFRDDGAPGPRPQYAPDYVGAFLLDPDGNSVEAVHHGRTRAPGSIDHLWLRVADLAAARRFYLTIAPHAGITLGDDLADRVQFRGARATFSLVPGPPTEGLHLAFPAPRPGAVEAFHAAALAAGYADEGAPGRRPEHDPDHHAAFVRDPDGAVVEVVDHGDPGGAPG